MKSCLVDIHTHSAEKSPHIRLFNVLVKPGEEVFPPQGTWFSCGFHPWYLSQPFCPEQHLQQLELPATHSHCLALGEAGLDKRTHTSWDIQLKFFEMQVGLSERLQKPLIIHCVKAFDEILSIRKSHSCQQPWIVHGFNSSEQMAGQLARAGILISLGHHLLSESFRLRHLLESLPVESFFLETDDSSISIEEIYKAAARIRGESLEELATGLYDNFIRIFQPPHQK